MPDAGPIRSVQGLREAIDRIRQPTATHIVLYRGQRQANDLLPLLFRKLKTRVEAIRGIEATLLSRLKRAIPERTPLRPTNDWDWLSFGQHYRLPTRLLDWSDDPLIALFFAVERNPISPTVYVYHAQKRQIVAGHAKRGSPADITITRIMKPSVHSVRVALQGGWHTVHRLHPRRSGGKIAIPLADLRWHEGRLANLTIDLARADAILGELAKTGLRHETVYGDFEKVCASICRECGIS